MDLEAKKQELEQLRQRAARLEAELAGQAPVEASDWPPKDFYLAYYATTGFMLGGLGAVTSLLFNVIGAPISGKQPLELIRVFLTFPLGERALSLTSEANGGLILAMGCCLYIATGMVLGVPLYVTMVRICGNNSSLVKRVVVGAVLGLVIWALGFYGILSWLQPLLFKGNWITDASILPPWVAAATHVVFGVTLAVFYGWGQFTAYRPGAQSEGS